MAGKFAGYWPMVQGSAEEKKAGRGQEVHKCTDCGHVTEGKEGWNSAPDHHGCSSGCANKRRAESDWRPGAVSEPYRQRYDQIDWSKK